MIGSSIEILVLSCEPSLVNLTALSICGLIYSEDLAHDLNQGKPPDSDTFVFLSDRQDFANYLAQERHSIDCLILEWSETTAQVITDLHHSATLMPAILVFPRGTAPLPTRTFYHVAELLLASENIQPLSVHLETAITAFVKLCRACPIPPRLRPHAHQQSETSDRADQQHRLAEKLKERLGYLGVYYKRDTDFFFRRLTSSEKQSLLDELRLMYRAIILEYFSAETNVNQHIDEFVGKAFFADISVSQVLELHVELMDNFAKQLKLEGRNEDILLDYRLTLIDIIAHLCEMYRRSIPREA